MTSFTKEQQQSVWDVADRDPDIRKDPDIYRQDPYGNTIMHSKYGDNTPMGWQIDHIIPKKCFEECEILEKSIGINDLENLQAMQSEENNRQRDSLDKKTRHGITARQFLKEKLSN